jgi:hypothetical protein
MINGYQDKRIDLVHELVQPDTKGDVIATRTTSKGQIQVYRALQTIFPDNRLHMNYKHPDTVRSYTTIRNL